MYNGDIEPISDQFPVLPESFFYEKEKEDENGKDNTPEAK
tara:strand:+ start:662 stop:781 length:120 start_codon:yes stop_codon:yes gene_type:complete